MAARRWHAVSSLLNPRFYGFAARRFGSFASAMLWQFRAERLSLQESPIRASIGPHAFFDTTDGLSIGEAVHIGAGVEILSAGGNSAVNGLGRIRIGDHVKIGRRVQLGRQGGATLEVGDYTSIHNGCILLGDVSIGRYCLLSNNVFVSSGDHFARIRPHWLIKDQDALVASVSDFVEERTKAVIIEDDCWIGWGAVIKRGVYIGKGAIVGANAVVTRDVAPYSIQAGTPSQSIGSRLAFTPPATVQATREIDWPYFYAGFRLRQVELSDSLKAGVVHAGPDARLVLQGGQWSSLSIDGTLPGGVTTLRVRLTVNGMSTTDIQLDGPRFRCQVPIKSDSSEQSAARKTSVLGGFTQIRIEVIDGPKNPNRIGQYGLSQVSLS